MITRIQIFLEHLWFRLFGFKDAQPPGDEVPETMESDDMAKKKKAAKKKKTRSRSAIDGKFVSKSFATKHKKTTIDEKR